MAISVTIKNSKNYSTDIDQNISLQQSFGYLLNILSYLKKLSFPLGYMDITEITIKYVYNCHNLYKLERIIRLITVHIAFEYNVRCHVDRIGKI